MKFTDECSRDDFHKIEALVQVVCAIFERFCLIHGYEPELIESNGEYTYLGVPDISDAAADDVCEQVNHQFPRVDTSKTCTLREPDYRVFELFVTSAKDFGNLQ